MVIRVLFSIAIFWLGVFYSMAALPKDNCPAHVSIEQVQKTRFGNVNLVSFDCTEPSAIFFHGHEIYNSHSMVVSIGGYFRIKDTDVILIGSNPGGSATPLSSMVFLIIHSRSRIQSLTAPGFFANTPDISGLKRWVDKNDRIFVDLGFDSGKDRVAELDRNKLVVHSNLEAGISLDDKLCDWLYRNGMKNCQSDVAHKQGCGTYSNPAGIYGSTSAMNEFSYIGNQPGYSQSGFNNSCLAWCEGKDISYQRFREISCGYK